MKLSTSCKLIVTLIFVIVLPFKTIQANITNTYEFRKTGNTAGQTSPLLDFSVDVLTAGLLEMQYFVNVTNDNIPGRHCSDVRLHILIDNSTVFTTDWLGYQGRVPALPLDTGLINLGPVTPGLHTLTLSPEGRVSGCNQGLLWGWGGTLKITTIPVQSAITVDIYPNRTPNRVFLSRNYTLYVSVLGSETFDVTTLNSSTVKFGKTGTEASPMRAPLIRDLNGDCYLDAMYGFMTYDCGFALGDTQGWLKGSTASGIPVEGSDSVLVYP
jgi:hypothetical protein